MNTLLSYEFKNFFLVVINHLARELRSQFTEIKTHTEIKKIQLKNRRTFFCF